MGRDEYKSFSGLYLGLEKMGVELQVNRTRDNTLITNLTTVITRSGPSITLEALVSHWFDQRLHLYQVLSFMAQEIPFLLINKKSGRSRIHTKTAECLRNV